MTGTVVTSAIAIGIAAMIETAATTGVTMASGANLAGATTTVVTIIGDMTIGVVATIGVVSSGAIIVATIVGNGALHTKPATATVDTIAAITSRRVGTTVTPGVMANICRVSTATADTS